MKMNKIIIIALLLLLTAPICVFTQETPVIDSNTAVSKGSDYSTSIYIRYNITRPDYAKTPYMLGLDAGADMDLGSDIYVLKLAGIGISGRYILLNNKNDLNGELSTSHYLSTGFSIYFKTRYKKPINFGIRAGTGSGWLIDSEIDEETANNKRLNGIYLDGGFYSVFEGSGNLYFETGTEVRKQYYFKEKKALDPVDMGCIYIKAGLKL